MNQLMPPGSMRRMSTRVRDLFRPRAPTPRVVPTLLAAEPLLGQTGAGEVTTTLMVLGPAGVRRDLVPDWQAEHEYANGNLIRLHGRVVFCLTAGESGATLPVAAEGDVSDGAVIWRPCVGSLRRGLILCNIDSTRSLEFDFYRSGLGPRLSPGNGTLILTGADCPQGAVYVTAVSGSAAYRVTEW
jgi:hypothetical protein